MAALSTPKTSFFGKPRLVFTTPSKVKTGLRLKGFINAPGEFYEKRKEVLFRRGMESNTYLLFDYSASTITLRVDNGQGDYDEVIGQFIPHTILSLMNFDSGKEFEALMLRDYITNHGLFLDDELAYNSAIEFLTTPTQSISDTRASSKPEVFSLRLNLPLHKGCRTTEKYPEEICLLKYTTNKDTYCFLESPMWVKSYLEDMRDSVFERERKRFKDFVCIDC